MTSDGLYVRLGSFSLMAKKGSKVTFSGRCCICLQVRGSPSTQHFVWLREFKILWGSRLVECIDPDVLVPCLRDPSLPDSASDLGIADLQMLRILPGMNFYYS